MFRIATSITAKTVNRSKAHGYGVYFDSLVSVAKALDHLALQQIIAHSRVTVCITGIYNASKYTVQKNTKKSGVSTKSTISEPNSELLCGHAVYKVNDISGHDSKSIFNSEKKCENDTFIVKKQKLINSISPVPVLKKTCYELNKLELKCDDCVLHFYRKKLLNARNGPPCNTGHSG